MTEQQQNLDNYTKGFGLALIIVVLFNGILTILKEEIKGIHDVLAFVFWHHWFGHGIVVLAAFVIMGLLFSRSKTSQTAGSLTLWVIWATVIGAGLIAVFFALKMLA